MFVVAHQEVNDDRMWAITANWLCSLVRHNVTRMHHVFWLFTQVNGMVSAGLTHYDSPSSWERSVCSLCLPLHMCQPINDWWSAPSFNSTHLSPAAHLPEVQSALGFWHQCINIWLDQHPVAVFFFLLTERNQKYTVDRDPRLKKIITEMLYYIYNQIDFYFVKC